MRVTAFDASLLRTGVCCLDDGNLKETGTIEPRADWPRRRQLGHIFSMTGRWLHSVNIVAIETSRDWQRASSDSRESVDAMAMARAAIMLVVERETGGVRLVEMDSHRVRELIYGNRNASKQQVQAALLARGYALPTIEKRVLEGGHIEPRVIRGGVVKQQRVGGSYVVRAVVDPDIADAIALAVAVWSEQRLLAMKEAQ